MARSITALLVVLAVGLVAAVGLSRVPRSVSSGASSGDTAHDMGRNLRGVWSRDEPGATFSDMEPAMTAWAEERFRLNKPTVGPAAALDANDPTVQCVPPGVPYVLVVPVPFEFIDAGDRMLQLFEYNHNVRWIYTDGRPHPTDLRDTDRAQWMGHSIGWWEGSTFVIETIGFNDQSWLDRLGHPHSSNLRVIERIRRVSEAALDYDVIVEDAQAYVAPWRGRMRFVQRPGAEIFEHHCVPENAEYARFRQRAWMPDGTASTAPDRSR
jgi:hypothetical protein